MRDLAEFFTYMNDINFRYVVLRNWENLPYKVETGEHSDLDLLVYDLEHFLEVFPHLERVYPAPRVQFKLHFDDGEYVQIDARSTGDDYYPFEFEENLLKTREWNSNGFWTPNHIHFKIGLAYHAVHHKGVNSYQKYLGPETVENLLEALKKNSELCWVEPEDPSVGRFYAYLKGGTSIVDGNGATVTKKQFKYRKYDVISNEERILKLMDNPHFPKLISRDGDAITIEHCGEPLSEITVPDNWKHQFEDILESLDSYGIIHRDVRVANLMVRDGIIKLLDFGWARLSSEKDGKHPDMLGFPNKCPLGFNDRYSMNRVIRQMEYKLEEVCQMVS